MIDLLLALILGILAGTFTGLMPGIHINLVATALLANLIYFKDFSAISLVIFIVSMSITHVFLDFIPAIFLGSPEEDSFLSILPGHQMLMEGKGYEACLITLYGCLFSLILIILLFPIYIFILPKIYSEIMPLVPFSLILISTYIVFRDEDILLSSFIFIFSGLLGFLTFNLPVKEPLFPLLTGLFGLSSLIIGLDVKEFKEQQITQPHLEKREIKKLFFTTLLVVPLFSFLPGLSSAHTTTISSEITKQENKSFLFLNGLISPVVMSLSFFTIYSINKSRSGSASAVKEILEKITLQDTILILTIILITGVSAFFLGKMISKVFAKSLNKINYKKITLSVTFLLILTSFIFTNLLGIIVLISATSLGIFCISSNVRRINLMGALILPVIIYYLFY